MRFVFLHDGTREAFDCIEPLAARLRVLGGNCNWASIETMPEDAYFRDAVVIVALRLPDPRWFDLYARREEIGCRVFRLSRGIGNIVTGADFGAEFAYVPGPSSVRANPGHEEKMLAVGSLKLQYVREQAATPGPTHSIVIAGDAIPGSTGALWSLFPDRPADPFEFRHADRPVLTQHPGADDAVRAEYHSLDVAKGFIEGYDTGFVAPRCGAFLCSPSSAVVFEAMLHRRRIGLVPYVDDIPSLAGTPFPVIAEPEDIDALLASEPLADEVTAPFVADHVLGLDVDSAALIAEHMEAMLA